jgi:hypothetical protein
MFRVLTEEELRDSKDLGRVKVGAGCQTRTPLVLRVKTPILAGLVAGWNGMLREWVVDELTVLLVVVLSADLMRVAGLYGALKREWTVDERAVMLVVVVVLSADLAVAGWKRV